MMVLVPLLDDPIPMYSISRRRDAWVHKMTALDFASHNLNLAAQPNNLLRLIVQHHRSLYRESWVEIEAGIVVFYPGETSDAACFFCGQSISRSFRVKLKAKIVFGRLLTHRYFVVGNNGHDR